MKYFVITLYTLLIFSCNEKNKIEGKLIDKFETTLGGQETKYLNEIVHDFDSYLMTKYQEKNSDSEFKQYLAELSESKKPDFWNIDETKLDNYLKSNLFAKYDSIYPDSVWYDGLSFCSKYPHSDFINEMIPIKRNNQELNIDSIINSRKKTPRLEEIEPSYFQIALESIMTKDSLIINYIDAKHTHGTISSRLIASGLLYSLNPEKEYFAKRIMIMEMND